MADWYYTANGQQAGPVDLPALRQMIDAGSVSRTELVFGPGLAQWTPAGQVPGLAGDAAAAASVTGVPMIGYRGVEVDTTGLSAAALNALRGTKPWVRFISIMAFVGAGFMGLGGLSMVFILSIAGAKGGKSGVPFWLGGVYVALAAIYVIPAVLLTRYANSIGRLMHSQRMSDVEQALGAQRAFWKFCGIAIIVFISLYIVGIVAVIIFKMRV